MGENGYEVGEGLPGARLGFDGAILVYLKDLLYNRVGIARDWILVILV